MSTDQQQPSTTEQETALQNDWHSNPRWAGVKRDYTAGDVVKLRGSVQEEFTLAKRGAEQLWDKLHSEDYINTLGALTGNQAVQQVKAGLKAIYLSGWQVAGDANLAGQTYPDQSIYPANSVPAVVRRINNALLRADQIEFAEGTKSVDEVRSHRRVTGRQCWAPAALGLSAEVLLVSPAAIRVAAAAGARLPAGEPPLPHSVARGCQGSCAASEGPGSGVMGRHSHRTPSGGRTPKLGARAGAGARLDGCRGASARGWPVCS